LEAQKQTQEAALEVLRRKASNSSLKGLTRLVYKKRGATGAPTLRNFREGRYEDVLEGFEIKKAKKKGIIFKEK
jgi:hypothetical protein